MTTVGSALRHWRSQAEAWTRQITVWTGWRARGSLLCLTVGPSAIRGTLRQRGLIIWAGECAWASPADLTEAIGRLAAELPTPCRRATVVLERPVVQRRMLHDLPPVRAAVLPALVAAQDRRFFRRNGQPLVSDAVWAEHAGARVAKAAAVEGPLIEAIGAGARAAGLALTAIAPADDPDTLSLLPAAERAGRVRRARHRVAGLAGVTAAVWLGAGLLFGARLTWERRQIDAELAAVEAPLAALRAARAELRNAEAAVTALHATDAARGRALTALGAIARALPDSAIVTAVTWTAADTGVLVGVAARAADAVAALRRARALPNPRLAGRVTPETVAGRAWERFTIVFGPRAPTPATADAP